MHLRSASACPPASLGERHAGLQPSPPGPGVPGNSDLVIHPIHTKPPSLSQQARKPPDFEYSDIPLSSLGICHYHLFRGQDSCCLDYHKAATDCPHLKLTYNQFKYNQNHENKTVCLCTNICNIYQHNQIGKAYYFISKGPHFV